MFAWISEQTAIISLYSINLSIFKTEAERVYCALRNGSLNQTDRVSYLKGQYYVIAKNSIVLIQLFGTVKNNMEDVQTFKAKDAIYMTAVKILVTDPGKASSFYLRFFLLEYKTVR